MAGLSCAHALARKGADVVLLEAGGEPGGVVRSERRDGYLVEWGPNTVRPTPELWALLQELGLSSLALLASSRMPRFVDWGGRLIPVPMSPGALAGTPLLTLSGKLRLLREPFVRSRGAPEESLRDFVSRRLGPEVAERFVEPFVSGVFAGDSGRLEAAQAFPALSRLERDHGSILWGAIASRRKGAAAAGPRPPRGLLSFPEGLATLPRALASALGERFEPARSVTGIARADGAWRVTHSGGELACERLVLAVPADAAARLIAGLAPDAARALEQIPHPPLAVLHLSYAEGAFPSPPAGFGHLTAPGSGRRILGAIYASALFPGRAPEGRVLLTVFLGGAKDPGAVELTDEALVEAASADLRATLGARGDPSVVGIRKHARAIPQYDRGHGERVRAFERAERDLGGLTLLGNYRGGISVGDVVASGRQAAEGVLR
jgi:oxygen-dependent protoporphyrinogen oxidase